MEIIENDPQYTVNTPKDNRNLYAVFLKYLEKVDVLVEKMDVIIDLISGGIIPPTNFRLLPPDPVFDFVEMFENDEGVYTNIDYESFDVDREVEMYLSVLTGNDANDGLTALTGKKTYNNLKTTFQTNNPTLPSLKIIATEGGAIEGGLGFTNTVENYPISVVCTDTTPLIVPLGGRAGTEFSFFEDDVYRRVSLGHAGVFDFAHDNVSRPNEGFPFKLVLAGSIQLCKDTAGSYFIDVSDSNRMYIHLIDSRVPDRFVCTSNAVSTNDFEPNFNCYMKNVAIVGGQNQITIPSINVQNCVFQDVKLIDSSRDSLVHRRNSGESTTIYLKNVIGTDYGKDGLNYGENVKVLEDECNITEGGGFDTSCNASTGHVNSIIIRLNSRYIDSQDRTVHDVVNCKSWILGCQINAGLNGSETRDIALCAGAFSETDDVKIWGYKNNIDGSAGTAIEVFGNPTNTRVYLDSNTIEGTIETPDRVEVYEQLREPVVL